ncbi:hypothetical protein BT93_G0803 [Corymbia citriodora subsp. variegata]|nr:hypothetical protein BT93_G0803 [Corymbia citriodora subsp. variegata]
MHVIKPVQITGFTKVELQGLHKLTSGSKQNTWPHLGKHSTRGSRSWKRFMEKRPPVKDFPVIVNFLAHNFVNTGTNSMQHLYLFAPYSASYSARYKVSLLIL